MREIFKECFRVLKPTGLMTLMFTHKTQEAWESLTRALVESGWTITSTFPVESEFGSISQHIGTWPQPLAPSSSPAANETWKIAGLPLGPASAAQASLNACVKPFAKD